MRTILIVDDDQTIIDVLIEAITADLPDVTCVPERDFSQAVRRMEIVRPDAVVLDLLEGPVVVDPPGQRAWQSIWGGRFCPVVIYTAFGGELTPPVPTGHPFVKTVVKGPGTQTEVVQHLQAFQPLVAAIQLLHREVDTVLQRVLRDTAGTAAIAGADAAVLVHAGRRRVAALMDEKTATEQRQLFSWEQYLIPAFGDDPLAGDLIRRTGAAWDDYDAYRVVLSPSCDMVAGRHEPSILVARCSSVHAMKQRLSLPANAEKAADRVRTLVLTQGFWNGYLPLPAFPDRIPLLIANLKDLEVLPYVSLKPAPGGRTEFDRIASIDSPFREQVAWAFLNTVARPGMPERDVAQWAENIIAAGPARLPTRSPTPEGG